MPISIKIVDPNSLGDSTIASAIAGADFVIDATRQGGIVIKDIANPKTNLPRTPTATEMRTATVVRSSAVAAEVLELRGGTIKLVAGSATVMTKLAGGAQQIFLSNMLGGGTPGALYVTGRTAISFTIASTSGSDTSTVAWKFES